jgi:1-acyl-sn-glycerol-3-phosphate acyltransferase
MGVFPITRKTADAQSLKRAVKMLKRGELVGIFPEGTRMRDGRRGKAHKGIGLVAHMANVDVLPYRIWNTQRIKPKGSTFPHFPRVVVRFGTVMSLNDARYDNLPKNDKYKLFAQDIMDAIYSLDPPDGVKVKPDPAGYGPLDAQRDADATLDEGATGTDGTAGATDAAQRDSKES